MAFTLKEIECQHRLVSAETTWYDLYSRKITGAMLKIEWKRGQGSGRIVRSYFISSGKY